MNSALIESVGRSWQDHRGTRTVTGTHPSGKLLVKHDQDEYPELVAPESLESEVKLGERQAASRKQMKERGAEHQKSEDAATDKLNDTKGFADKMNALDRGKAIAFLNSSILVNKELDSVKNWVEKLIGMGYTIEGNRIVSPTGNFFEGKRFGKIGMQFFEYLQNKT